MGWVSVKGSFESLPSFVVGGLALVAMGQYMLNTYFFLVPALAG